MDQLIRMKNNQQKRSKDYKSDRKITGTRMRLKDKYTKLNVKRVECQTERLLEPQDMEVGNRDLKHQKIQKKLDEYEFNYQKIKTLVYLRN